MLRNVKQREGSKVAGKIRFVLIPARAVFLKPILLPGVIAANVTLPGE